MALGEDEHRRYELQEGSLVSSPNPRPDHAKAVGRLHLQLARRCRITSMYYWIIDIEPPVSLLACHLTEAFGYVDDGAVAGSFKTVTPFPVEVDLAALR